MILKENLSLNRYEWASQKISSILSEQKGNDNTLFDIGARDVILKKYINPSEINYKAFDLFPLDESAEQWDIEKPFPYAYPPTGVASLLEVIEHLNNPGICLKNIANVIKPGGYLILTTPNPKWSTATLNLFATGELSCFTQSDLDLNHHVFTPWVHIVESLLADAGFEIIEYVTLDGKTTIFDKTLFKGNPIKRFMSRLVKKIIEKRNPAACGMSYGLVIKKIA